MKRSTGRLVISDLSFLLCSACSSMGGIEGTRRSCLTLEIDTRGLAASV